MMVEASALTELKRGRYAVLLGNFGGDDTAIGVLLEDPSSGQVWLRMRRDWDALDSEDPVLPLLEDDLRSKAEQMGAERFFAWIEQNLSANLRTTDRETVVVSDFERTLDRLYSKHVSSRVTAATHVPRYSLRSAAGKFLDNAQPELEGWEELPPGLRAKDGMFAAHIAGTSMEPVVPDGSVALFQANVTGSRSGRLVLVEENGTRYTLKRFQSYKSEQEGSWRHQAVVLEPLNPAHEPIVLSPEEDRYRVVAWFVDVLY